MNIHLAKLLSDIVIFFTGEEEEATHRSWKHTPKHMVHIWHFSRKVS
jgi:hypothetical protein